MLPTARRIFRYRGLLVTLTARELKGRYRGSVLGFFWSLVNPLLLLAVYALVFGYVFTPERAFGVSPYALFLVSGLFPWIWVSGALLEGAAAFITQSALIRKAVFPAELLPMVAVLAHGVHFLLALPVLAAALVAGRLMGHEDVGGWTALLLPVVVLLELPLLAGLTLGLAALNAHFKDVRDLLANLLTLLFFLTPILYPLAAIPQRLLRAVVIANPFTPFTLAYQDLLFYGRLPGWETGALMVAVSAVGWLAGSLLFERLRDTLVEAV